MEERCTHSWFLDSTISMGNGNPYFLYVCEKCRQKEKTFSRKKETVVVRKQSSQQLEEEDTPPWE
jgi:hypothetical protein